MNRSNNVVHVVKGASASGKSWVCESLTNVKYVRFDDGSKTCSSRLVEASKERLPIVTDPTVVRSDLDELLKLPKVFACYYIIAENHAVVKERVERRGGSMTESLAEKVCHYERFKGRPGFHVGSSSEILEVLQKIVSSQFWTYGIYEISSGQLIYVGKAKNNGGRFANHACSVNQAMTGKDPEVHKALYRYMARRILHGDNFTLKILGATESENEAYELESRSIFEHRASRTLFNVDSGGNGPRGSFKVDRREVSSETREKLSEARRGLKFDVGYANRGCWRLSDDEVEMICGDRGVESIRKDSLGRIKLEDSEVASIRNRRNLIKYHRDALRRKGVLDWHHRKSGEFRAAKAEALGLSDVPKRITHLAALTVEQRNSRRLKLASLHRRRRIYKASGNSHGVSAILREIRDLETSFGVVPVHTDIRCGGS